MEGAGSANLWVLLGLGLAGIIMATRKLTKVVKEDFGAFFSKFQLLPPPQPAPPKAPHPPVTALTFAVSDIFDIEGHVTGFGNPDWERTHAAAASRTSTLVEAGATCVGKTILDELSFISITGENKHYGTPTNHAIPPCVPGGSSSGAAVAVDDAKLVDFSLGIDSNRRTQALENYDGEDRTAPATQSGDKKKRSWRSGTRALREICHFQKSTELLIPAAPFIRTVREITYQYSPEVSRWTPEALVELQEASEDFLVHLFEDGMLCAINASDSYEE